jgi:hypothetical protein
MSDEIFKVWKMEEYLFWAMTPGNLVEVCRRFGGTSPAFCLLGLIVTLKMEAVYSTETSKFIPD